MSVGLVWEGSRSREQGSNMMLNRIQERVEYLVSISDLGGCEICTGNHLNLKQECTLGPLACGQHQEPPIFHVPARYSDPLFQHSAKAQK